jgi:hypothetical protein
MFLGIARDSSKGNSINLKTGIICETLTESGRPAAMVAAFSPDGDALLPTAARWFDDI